MASSLDPYTPIITASHSYNDSVTDTSLSDLHSKFLLIFCKCFFTRVETPALVFCYLFTLDQKCKLSAILSLFLLSFVVLDNTTAFCIDITKQRFKEHKHKCDNKNDFGKQHCISISEQKKTPVRTFYKFIMIRKQKELHKQRKDCSFHKRYFPINCQK